METLKKTIRLIFLLIQSLGTTILLTAFFPIFIIAVLVPFNSSNKTNLQHEQ